MPKNTDTVFIEQRGLSDALRAMRELSNPKQATSMMRSSMRVAAKPMIFAAKFALPYGGTDDHHIRDNVKLRLTPKRLRRTSVDFRIGIGRVTKPPGEDGYHIVGGLSKRRNAPNYGNIHAPEPFMRAFDQEAPTTIRLFARDLGRRIENLAKRIARQQARSQ